MIIFTLTMPGVNSWNGKWTGAESVHAICRSNTEVPREVVGESFSYNFGDGWVAMVSVERIGNADAKKIMSKSAGFSGYDWMVDSIIQNKAIKTPNKEERKEEEELKDIKKITFEELKERKDWEEAVVVIKKESFKKEYSEESRSYAVSADAKYFDHSKIGNSLFANCLDGTDDLIRLDAYLHAENKEARWEVEFCYILE